MNKAIACVLSLCAALAVLSCGGGGESAAPQLDVSPLRAPAAASVPAGLDATGLMNWAEVQYAAYFPTHEANQSWPPFIYRHYGNGNYLGVADDLVYIMGPVAGGNAPQVVATLAQFTCRVLPQNCTTTGSRVRGTVIGKGAALAGATVTLRDIAGITRSTTTTASGTYSLDASNLAPPFLVTATGANASGAATNLVSVGRLGGGLQDVRINVTPWTTAIAAMLSPTGKAGDLQATRDRTRINGSLTVVITYSATLIAPSLTAAGVSATDYDPIAAPLDANGTGIAAMYADLTVGTTPSNAVFMASSSGRPCAPAQLGDCVRYSNPGTQTITNPNVCGSDIATGAPIPCDSSLPLTSVPQPISITPSLAYNFGCLGCVFWGPADNYAAPPTQAPIQVHVTVTTSTWYAHFSVTACAAGTCFSSGVTSSITGTAYEAQASCQQAAQIIASAFNGAASQGITYSFTCTQSP